MQFQLSKYQVTAYVAIKYQAQEASVHIHYITLAQEAV